MEGAFAFTAAGAIVVSVPVATGEADEAADLFGERLTGERGFGVFFGGHGLGGGAGVVGKATLCGTVGWTLFGGKSSWAAWCEGWDRDYDCGSGLDVYRPVPW